MKELQAQVYAILSAIHPRVYLERAPQEGTFPYVVYNLPSSSMGADHREDFILEVDVWDRPEDGSTLAMQQIADAIDAALDGLVVRAGGNWVARVYRIGRFMLPDPDLEIRRRQLRYEIRTYRAGET